MWARSAPRLRSRAPAAHRLQRQQMIDSRADWSAACSTECRSNASRPASQSGPPAFSEVSLVSRSPAMTPASTPRPAGARIWHLPYPTGIIQEPTHDPDARAGGERTCQRRACLAPSPRSRGGVPSRKALDPDRGYLRPGLRGLCIGAPSASQKEVAPHSGVLTPLPTFRGSRCPLPRPRQMPVPSRPRPSVARDLPPKPSAPSTIMTSG